MPAGGMTEVGLRRARAACGAIALLLAVLGGPLAAQQAVAPDQAIRDLRSPSTRTRIDALRALSEAGRTDAAIPMAATLLDGNDNVQLAAVEALLKLYAVPADLRGRQWGVAGSSDPPATYPEAAFEAGPLATIPAVVPPEVLVNLAAVMRNDDSSRTRVSAAYALGVLAAPAMGPLPQGVTQPVITDVVYAMSHPDLATRQVVARMAGRVFAPPAGQAAPVAVGDALIGAMNDRDVAVREWAMESLGFLRCERAVQALTERVSYYGKGDEGTSALHALARIANPASRPIFLALLVNGYVPYQLLAVEGLGRLRDRTALPQIEQTEARSTDPGVALAADYARLMFGQGDAARIADGLARPVTAVQARVYLAEIARETPAALHPLLVAASPSVRATTADLLGASRHPDEAAALEPLLGNPSPEVVRAVSEAIHRLRAYAAVAPRA